MEFDNTEISVDIVEPVTDENIIIDDTESIQNENNTEIVPSSETDSIQVNQESSAQTVAVDYTPTLESIGNDVHIIMFIVLFSFCWNCMKNWRTKSLKGVRK